VVEQGRLSFLKTNRLPALLGFILGAFVPVAAFELVHFEVAHEPKLWVLVCGALLYSAITVFTWAEKAFKNSYKAIGFCVLLEGILSFSENWYLASAALVILAGINGVATGCTLSLDLKHSRIK
jgi:hypothetical protein